MASGSSSTESARWSDRWVVAMARGLTGWVRGLSYSNVQRLGAALGRWLGKGLRYRRREVIATMTRCLSDRTPSEIPRLADAMYVHLGRTLLESMWIRPEGWTEWVTTHVEIHRADVVHSQVRTGRGCLILTAHAGNFDLLCCAAPALGFPLTIIAKQMRNAVLDREVRGHWRSFGVETLPPRGVFRQALRAIQSGRIVGFMLDQNMTRDEGIFVEFFGQPACTTPGLAWLAACAQVPVVPVFIHREPDGRHRIDVGEPCAPPARNEREIHEATARYTRVIEDWIRVHPSQWIWIHRRWRTQPEPGDHVVSGAV